MKNIHDRMEIGTNYKYHVVGKYHNDSLESYHIYFNNRPCLLPTEDFALTKEMAQKIVNLLNTGKLNVTPRPAHFARSSGGSRVSR